MTMVRERFNHEMLMIARSLREMKQGDLAKAIGTTQGRISKIEHGLIPPPPELIAEFSRVLKFPESFFFQLGHLYALPTRHHRKREKLAKRTLERIHAEITVRTMNMAKLLQSADIEGHYDVPEFDLDELASTPEEVARLVRERWDIPRGPIANFVEVLERASVVIVSCDFGAPEVDAVGMRVPGMPPLMFVNSAMPVDRMRFTVAHELGHLVMHRLPRAEMEKEANRFAAELLMPEADIKPQLRSVNLELLATLKRVWRVAMSALMRRAYTLKTISAAAYQRYMKMFTANGWRRREPAELDLTPEPATVLAQLIKFHQEQLGFDISELSSIVNLYASQFHEWYPTIGLRLVS